MIRAGSHPPGNRRANRLVAMGCLILVSAGSVLGETPELTRIPEEKILDFIAENVPSAIPVLQIAKSNNPDAYWWQMKSIDDLLIEYHQIRKQSPQRATVKMRGVVLHVESGLLATKLEGMPEGEMRNDLEASVRAKIAEQYDLELKQPELEIRELEEEIRNIRDLLDRRRAMKEKVVDRRFRQLLGQADPTP